MGSCYRYEESSENYNFKVKKIFSNGLCHLEFDKEDSVEDYDASVPEVLFHHSWMWMEDTLNIVPKLNVFKKQRGAPGGPDLVDMNIDDVKASSSLSSKP